MSWMDRIGEAAYTSPGGTRQTFDFTDLSKSIDKKTAGYDFPDADGTYVQDLGRAGSKFPIRAYFHGADCDLEAEAFEALLLERGDGILEHPVYGQRKVVPFGSITRRDDLVTAANQVVIEVTFWETTGLIYPTPSADPGTEAAGALGEYNDAAASEFADTIQTDTELQKVTLKSRITAGVAALKAGMKAISDVQAAVQKEIQTITDSINGGIDLLIAQPLTLANQMIQLIQAPGRALASIRARLDGYKNLAAAIFGGSDSEDGNDLRTEDLQASAYVSGAVVSALNNQFETKTAALSVAAELLEFLEDLTAWRDEQFAVFEASDDGTSLPVLDTGGAYEALQTAVATAAGYLVEISFSLKQERRIVLDRPRNIIELVGELYGGGIDSNLDFFITSNSLNGDEIFELPAGREVKYYV